MKPSIKTLIEDYVLESHKSIVAIREHLARRGVRVPRHKRLDDAVKRIQREREVSQNEQI